MLRLTKTSSVRPKATCPACGRKRKFVRYWDDEKDSFFPDETVGACDRIESCGYHKKPKESSSITSRPVYTSSRPIMRTKPKYNYFTREHLSDTLANYWRNGLLQYLLSVYQDRTSEVWRVFDLYKVGTYCDNSGNYTCFPYIDRQGRFCRGKLIEYPSDTGHKTKLNSLNSRLGFDSFNHSPVMFGEHLLNANPSAVVAIFESEKSALVGAMHTEVFGDTIWIAAGAMLWLNSAKILALGNRKVILYPDAQQEEKWEQFASEANNRGGNVHVSQLLKSAPKGTDLADVLIDDQLQRNELQGYSDEDIRLIREERISIMQFDGERSPMRMAA